VPGETGSLSASPTFAARTGFDAQIIVSRSGWRNGNGASSTESTTLKIAVLAPIPSASVRIAMTVKTGRLSSVRPAKRRSCRSVSMRGPPSVSTGLYGGGWRDVSGGPAGA
jgi:hypothetical protein